MKYNDLNITQDKKPTRAGRGIAAGRGKTAGRGTKGQSARSGGKVRPGFEGGQNPLYARLPKLKGFRSHKQPAQVVYTEQLNQFNGKTVDNAALFSANLIEDAFYAVKIVRKGELKSSVTVTVAKASAGAVEEITKQGGSFTETAVPQKPAQKKAKQQD